jgi:hypothetical protein
MHPTFGTRKVILLKLPGENPQQPQITPEKHIVR